MVEFFSLSSCSTIPNIENPNSRTQRFLFHSPCAEKENRIIRICLTLYMKLLFLFPCFMFRFQKWRNKTFPTAPPSPLSPSLPPAATVTSRKDGFSTTSATEDYTVDFAPTVSSDSTFNRFAPLVCSFITLPLHLTRLQTALFLVPNAIRILTILVWVSTLLTLIIAPFVLTLIPLFFHLRREERLVWVMRSLGLLIWRRLRFY